MCKQFKHWIDLHNSYETGQDKNMHAIQNVELDFLITTKCLVLKRKKVLPWKGRNGNKVLELMHIMYTLFVSKRNWLLMKQIL